MEPISAIGLGASVIGTLDIVTRTTSALRQLQQRWKSADMTVSLLVAELTTLKAVLNQISDSGRQLKVEEWGTAPPARDRS